MESKGKDKEKPMVKIRTPISKVSEPNAVEVLKEILLKLEELRMEIHEMSEFSWCSMQVAEATARTLRCFVSNVEMMMDHFVPHEEDEGKGMATLLDFFPPGTPLGS